MTSQTGPDGRTRGFPPGLAFVGILGIFYASFWGVRATNFGGHDEWLVLDLTSRGIVNLPYENRPLSLAFNLPGSLLTPYGLSGFWIVHSLYLSLSGALVFLIIRRVVPQEPGLAFLAGVVCVVWAPRDYMRLDVVLIANYAGATFATLLAVVLLLESWRLRGWTMALLAGLLGAIAIRALESTAALVLGGPALLFVLARREEGRKVVPWALLYWVPTGLALLAAVVPLLSGPASYQMSGLGLDLHPIRVARRLAQQFAFQLEPPRATLVAWHAPGAWMACSVFVVVWVLATRKTLQIADPLLGRRRRLLACLGGGVVGASLAFGPLVLSGATVTAARTQIISAPGTAVLLASVFCVLATFAPERIRRSLLGLAGACVVVTGVGRTAAMQREWDRASYWGDQSRSLRDLTDRIPDVLPNTLVVLLDDRNSWLATFTFRHALDYLYRGRAVGIVWGAQDFLYPVVVKPRSIRVEPWPVIRGPWRAPVTEHAIEEIVVARLTASGRLVILESWPTETLPPLSPDVHYAPWARISRGRPLPAERRMFSQLTPSSLR